MKRLGVVCLPFLLLMACIEPYEFDLDQKDTYITINGQVSDVSFNETLDYPSDGRYFNITLTYTSKPTNIKDVKLTDAQVVLEDDLGNLVSYVEVEDGEYYILDPDFEVLDNRGYRIRVNVSDENYFSEWSFLPPEMAPMDSVYFNESVADVQVYNAGEPEVVKKKSVTVLQDLATNSRDKNYYFWDYVPNWVYVAPLTGRQGLQTCWISNPLYLRDYVVAVDNGSGFSQALFELIVEDNEKVFEEMTVLIRQYSVSSGFYQYLADLQSSVSREGLFAEPPFNAINNLYHESDPEKKVSGYFSIVREQAQRWYFTEGDLSYFVNDRSIEDCVSTGLPPDPPAPECSNCMEYSDGTPTNVKPSWWR